MSGICKSSCQRVQTQKVQEQPGSQWSAPQSSPPKFGSTPKHKPRAVEIESNGSESGSLSSSSGDQYKCTSAEGVDELTRDDANTKIVEIEDDKDEDDRTLTSTQNEVNEQHTNGALMTEGQLVS